MKIQLTLLSISAIFFLAACTPEKETEKPSLETLESKVSYLLGFNSIERVKGQGAEIHIDAFIAGATQANADGEPEISRDKARAIFSEYEASLREKAQEAIKVAAVSNAEVSAKFLADNASKSGVKVTASGLQYKVISLGDGPKPSGTSQVTVDYEGKLIDGKIFDSSYERGQPATFGLKQVIAGWTEGLQLMPEGSKFEFYIPSTLAYGESGPASIGPNQALIFIVELHSATAK